MKLKSGKTYILPTSFGLVLGCVLFIQLLVSMTFGHPFSYSLSFLSIGLVIVCAFDTNSSLGKVKVMLHKKVFIEKDASTQIYLNLVLPSNYSRRVLLCNFDGEYDSLDQVVAGDSLFLKVPYSSLRRGSYSLPRIKIQTTYPFGIFRAWRYFDVIGMIYTYPKRGISMTLSSSNTLDHVTNVYDKESTSSKDEFKEHRKFRSSDSYKSIDWKAYARGRGLLTKEFSSTAKESEIFSLNKICTEYDLEAACDFLYSHYENKEVASLYYDNQLISTGVDLFHLENSLEFLSLFDLGGSDVYANL